MHRFTTPAEVPAKFHSKAQPIGDTGSEVRETSDRRKTSSPSTSGSSTYFIMKAFRILLHSARLQLS